MRVAVGLETEVLDSSFKVIKISVKVKVIELSQKAKELSHLHKRKRWLPSERLVPVYPTLQSMPWSLESKRWMIGVSVLTTRILTSTTRRSLKKLTTTMTSPSMIAALTFGTI